jgi:putative nucleotidyltransferase with HDIG domain
LLTPLAQQNKRIAFSGPDSFSTTRAGFKSYYKIAFTTHIDTQTLKEAGTVVYKKQTKKIPLAECAPGMRLAQDLFSRNDTLILPAGSVLDIYTIMRLRDMMLFNEVEILDLTEAEIASATQVFESQYKDQIDEMKDIYSSLETGNLLRMETVRSIVGDIINYGIGDRDILHSLNKLRSVDEYTYTHSLNVGILAMMLARWLRLDENGIRQACYAGVLHDIGKTRVSSEILNKPGKLTEAEFDEIKRHSAEGYMILQNNPTISEHIRQGVLMHHERIDGTGYPTGATAGKIHINGKIIAIADIFDAMVSDRCYHKRDCPFDVLEHFETQGLGHLDSKYMAIFIQKMSAYFIGEMVSLSDGRQAEVIFVNSFQLSRPVVKVEDQVIDLTREKDLNITALA